MATSGTAVFNPTVAELLDEAWERIGLDPSNITARHAQSARRSLNFALKHWSNQGIFQWPMDMETQALTTNLKTFTPPADTIDLVNVVYRTAAGVDTPMYPQTRAEYMRVSTKTTTGTPEYYFVERSINPVVYFYPASPDATGTIVYYRYRKLEDATAQNETLDVPSRYYEAVISDLAARLARKWAPDKYADMRTVALDELKSAASADVERASMLQRAPDAYNG